MKYTTENIPRSKYAELIEKSYRFRHNMEIGASFYFVYDVIKGYYIYLEDAFYDITGYPPSLMMRGKADFISKYIHPEDLLQYHTIRSKWSDLLEHYFKKDREKINFSFDFRLIKSDGSPVWLLYQTFHIEFSRVGQMLYIIGKCSDVSHWHKHNDMVLNLTSAKETMHYHFSSQKEKTVDKKVFSSLEKKIIKMLSEGLNSKDIADAMDITFNTANTHRRNMLRKAKVRNTSELVSFAHCHQLV